MLKDRDEAWNRVESLAMRHPAYQANGSVPNNNPFIEHNATNEDDNENEQPAYTNAKIEVKANEVSAQNANAPIRFVRLI